MSFNTEPLKPTEKAGSLIFDHSELNLAFQHAFNM